MKIFSARQIHEWDAYTIANESVRSIDLMERAAKACTGWLIQQELQNRPIKIFCAKGNNGGDGLAIARQLINAGAHPSVYILEFGTKGTDDFQANLGALHQLTTNIFFLQSEEFFPVIEKQDVIIDALYGIGLNRPVDGLGATLINYLNNAAADKVIAIDVPAGLFPDSSSKGNTIIKATDTLTFECLKLCCLMPENAEWLGEVHVLPIGLSKAFINNTETALELITAKQISKIYKPRKPFSHKGNFGHVLLIAGNEGKAGAAVLAAKSCLRSGVGLLTCMLPRECINIMQSAVHEAMIDAEDKINFLKFTTVAIGPGIGEKDYAIAKLSEILKGYKQPIVIDADALNVLSKNMGWLRLVPAGSILTPHPKEFDRLFGNHSNDFERMQKALQLSKEYRFVIVLKGHYTLTAYDGYGIFNTTGNAGMATGGSGDTLTGIIAALLAQQYKAAEAALLGVYLHGLAADLALEHQSVESLLPTDITEYLGKAFKTIAGLI